MVAGMEERRTVLHALRMVSWLGKRIGNQHDMVKGPDHWVTFKDELPLMLKAGVTATPH